MNQTDTIEIKDIDQLLRLLSMWHQRKISMCEHMMDAPEDIEVLIDNQEPVKLAGEFRKGFILGMSIALSEFKELPFVAEMEEAETASKH